MEIILAESFGMCDGVRRALKTAKCIGNPAEFSICGELVHNGEVMSELARRGFQILPENRRWMGIRNRIMITAHGMSDKKRKRLQKNREVVDATCPLVKKMHDTAIKRARESCFVVLAGTPGHAEVRGITEDLRDFAVVERLEDVAFYASKKIAVMCQTTSSMNSVSGILRLVKEKNPSSSVVYCDTICPATRKRQDALRKLCLRADFVVVAGGRNSNNTIKLCGIAEAMGVTARHVQGPGDLNPRWFTTVKTVGVTAGASTPDPQVNAICGRLKEIDANLRFLKSYVVSYQSR